VSDLQPTGELTEGDTVDVHYWGPEPQTEPPPETETTTTPTDEVTSETTEGEDG
jgi:hypothetical protein